MRFRKMMVTLLMGLGLITLAQPVLALTTPSLNGHVSDQAEVLSADFEKELNLRLTKLAKADQSAEVDVLTLKSLAGQSIEEVSQQVFKDWRIAQKNKDHRVLLVIAVAEKKIRLHTGESPSGWLTDPEAGRIIGYAIAPYLRQGAFEEGINIAIDAIENNRQGIPFEEPEVPLSLDQLWWVIGLYAVLCLSLIGLIYLAALYGKNKKWWPPIWVGLILGYLLGGPVVGLTLGLLGAGIQYAVKKQN